MCRERKYEAELRDFLAWKTGFYGNFRLYFHLSEHNNLFLAKRNGMLNEKIKELRKEKGLSLEQLADMIGTSRQTVHRYETGAISNIPSEKVEALARALDTTPARLMGWEEKIPSFNNNRTVTTAAKKRKLPILGNVACGEPIFATEQQGYYVEACSEITADFCLRARGDSMVNARIFDGDLLFVRQQDSVDDGDIAVVLIDDEATVKRVYFNREDGILTLMPENPTYKPMRYFGSQLDRIRILGKVVSGQYKI